MRSRGIKRVSGITLKLTASRIGTLRHPDVGLPHGIDGSYNLICVFK